jgi:hypothetical protein
MGRKLTVEIAKERVFKNSDGKIELLEYNPDTRSGKSHCFQCGRISDLVDCGALMSGRAGCKVCANKRYLHYDTIKKRLDKRGLKLLSKEYNGKNSSLLIQFSCGHSEYWSLNRLSSKKNNICKKCSRKKGNDLKILPESLIIETIKNAGYEFLNFPKGYVDGTSLVQYKCVLGHISSKKCRHVCREVTCSECSYLRQSILRMGEGSPAWKGGISILKKFFKSKIKDWKFKSMADCDYKCVITGGKFDNIHHLYSFSSIIQEAIVNVGLDKKQYACDYNVEELSSLVAEVQRLHTIYPLGVCLREDVHRTFHKLYKRENNTPEQWKEFVGRIKSGEIKFD